MRLIMLWILHIVHMGFIVRTYRLTALSALYFSSVRSKRYRKNWNILAFRRRECIHREAPNIQIYQCLIASPWNQVKKCIKMTSLLFLVQNRQNWFLWETKYHIWIFKKSETNILIISPINTVCDNHNNIQIQENN